MKPPEGKFGFVLRKKQDGRTFAVFACTRCPDEIEVSPGYPLNPEAVATRAERKGWQADGYHASAARCPACHGRGPRDARSPTPSPKEQPTVATTSQGASQEQLRRPSPDDKRAIRDKLDANFDDSTGRYIDGYSDQRIAEELKGRNIPWAWVRDVREAAYGPLRGDPEVDALRADIKKLVGDLAGLDRQGTALAARIGELDARLDTIEKQRNAT